MSFVFQKNLNQTVCEFVVVFLIGLRQVWCELRAIEYLIDFFHAHTNGVSKGRIP